MPIGVFDSGIGGLTVFKEIAASFPKVDLYYLGDTARVPYGNKSKTTIIRYSVECASYLYHNYNVDAIVIAFLLISIFLDSKSFSSLIFLSNSFIFCLNSFISPTY